MAFEVKGWCPGAHRPMMSGDGLVVRIAPRLGRLTQDQARALAELSLRYGNGLIDVTARGNLQIRGVVEGDHAALVSRLIAHGLIANDAETETRLTMSVTPFWAEGDETHGIAEALITALEAASDLTLPSKFGFVVDCGAAPVLRATSGDIRIERAADGLECYADGAMLGCPVTAEDAAETALELARWFVTSGGAPDGRGRMARHLATGADLPPRFAHVPVGDMAGPRFEPGKTDAGRLIGTGFGQIPAATLEKLAEIAPLRITPWRMILLEGAALAPDLPGLIHDPNDPLLRVDACPGAPLCTQAHAETRSLATQLAPHVSGSLHVSGCAKGCARQAPADVVLTATDAGFALAQNARAGDTPVHTGLSPAQVLGQVLAQFGAA